MDSINLKNDKGRRVHYICFYNIMNSNREVSVQPSAITKIDYIKSALKEIGCNVTLYSLAEGKTKGKWAFYNSQSTVIDNNENVLFISTWIRSNMFLKFFSRIWMWIQLLYYLLFKVDKTDNVILYHSLAIKPAMVFLKKCLPVKRNLIVEVEEIYAAAYRLNTSKIESENKYIRDISYKNIVVNDLIMNKCNLYNDFAICYGNYNKAGAYKKQEVDDGLIHIVYAGVIGGEKSDAFLAAKIAAALPSNYRTHILGYGMEADIENLKNVVKDINSRHNSIVVSYDGCLLEDEYISFLQKCQIGLCTRVLEDEYSDYTFPSKVLVYLSNNVLPVCTPIRCIQYSQISEYVVFSKDVTVDAIVNAILSIQSFSVDYSNILNKLHIDFLADMKKIVIC